MSEADGFPTKWGLKAKTGRVLGKSESLVTQRRRCKEAEKVVDIIKVPPTNYSITYSLTESVFSEHLLWAQALCLAWGMQWWLSLMMHGVHESTCLMEFERLELRRNLNILQSKACCLELQIRKLRLGSFQWLMLL